MLHFTYPVRAKPDQKDGGYVVSCRDIPEVISQGVTIEEALREAEGALQAAIECRLEDGLDFPVPSPAKRGEHMVATTIKRRKTARRTVSVAAVPRSSHEKWVVNRLKDPTMAAAYLETAISDGDQAALSLALRRVVTARDGVSKVPRRSRLSRETINHMITTSGNVELLSFVSLLAGVGLRLSIKPVAPRL